MLKIHKPNHKLLIISITSILSTGILLGFSALTYTPELSRAETVTYEPPKETRTMADITYMQEITPDICKNSELEKQYQLEDSRDQKIYWVTKLKNNSCWMTQSLRLDLHDVTLTSEDSDLPVGSSWTPISGGSELWIVDADDPYMIKYYNPGMYVETKPSDLDVCRSDGSTYVDGFSQCYYIGWRDVTGLLPSSDSLFGTDIDYISGIFNGHYLAGYYYTGMAATAGTARSISGYRENAMGSICPKGWRLPLGYGPNNTESIDDMMSVYELSANSTNSSLRVAVAPFYFAHAGMLSRRWNDTHTSYIPTLQSIGLMAGYWTSTSMNNTVLIVLGSNGAMGVQNLSSGFYYGHNVRCVARSDFREGYFDNVTISVTPTISLEVTDEVEIEKSEDNLSTANLNVTVSSNQSYNVSISSTSPDLSSGTNNITIPSKSGLLNTNENGWGIKLSSDTSYRAITSTPTTFYTASGAEVKTIPFIIGISTSPDLPNGEYSTDIVITATQN